MLNVHILSPERQLFEGEAESVSLPGADGRFQILRGHAPIVASLKDGQIEIAEGKNKKQFSIQSGFVEVLNNTVNILVQKASEV